MARNIKAGLCNGRAASRAGFVGSPRRALSVELHRPVPGSIGRLRVFNDEMDARLMNSPGSAGFSQPVAEVCVNRNGFVMMLTQRACSLAAAIVAAAARNRHGRFIVSMHSAVSGSRLDSSADLLQGVSDVNQELDELFGAPQLNHGVEGERAARAPVGGGGAGPQRPASTSTPEAQWWREGREAAYTASAAYPTKAEQPDVGRGEWESSRGGWESSSGLYSGLYSSGSSFAEAGAGRGGWSGGIEDQREHAGAGAGADGAEAVSRLTHVDAAGGATMVDVSEKCDTARVAVAEAEVHLGSDVFQLVKHNSLAKESSWRCWRRRLRLPQSCRVISAEVAVQPGWQLGSTLAEVAAAAQGDVLTVAKLSGIMAAKHTSLLIPLCHNILIKTVDVQLSLVEERHAVYIRAMAKTVGATGVEMEALTAAAVSALTVYDMCKAASKAIVVRQIRLVAKSGGKSGDYMPGATETPAGA